MLSHASFVTIRTTLDGLQRVSNRDLPNTIRDVGATKRTGHLLTFHRVMGIPSHSMGLPCAKMQTRGIVEKRCKAHSYQYLQLKEYLDTVSVTVTDN